jgi:hypothetical protein
MTPQEVRADIDRAINALSEARLAVDVNLPVLRRDGAEVLVTYGLPIPGKGLYPIINSARFRNTESWF